MARRKGRGRWLPRRWSDHEGATPSLGPAAVILAVAGFLVFSFPGSAWERTALEALPPERITREAEPRRQPVPRQSLATRCTGYGFQATPGSEKRFAHHFSPVPVTNPL